MIGMAFLLLLSTLSNKLADALPLVLKAITQGLEPLLGEHLEKRVVSLKTQPIILKHLTWCFIISTMGGCSILFGSEPDGKIFPSLIYPTFVS